MITASKQMWYPAVSQVVTKLVFFFQMMATCLITTLSFHEIGVGEGWQQYLFVRLIYFKLLCECESLRFYTHTHSNKNAYIYIYIPVYIYTTHVHGYLRTPE